MYYHNKIYLYQIYLFLLISNLILNLMKDRVIDTILKAGKPLKAGEIAEMSGLDKKEVDIAIKELRIENKIHSPKRCFYDVKK